MDLASADRRVSRRLARLTALPAALMVGSLCACGNRAGAQPVPPVGAADRVVHHFDFDERAKGNLETLPKFWGAVRPDGFPHFAGGGFDEDFGRTAPPSFHLRTEGRNVVFGYTGSGTRVRSNTDYRIVGHISPDRLTFGRACLSAYFLDHSGHPIVDSVVRSRWVGGADEVERWVKVGMDLPEVPPHAERIGVAVWVVQEPVWNDAVLPRRHIQRNDVSGGAWFDDITVYALPRMALATSTPTNVLSPEDSQVLFALLADYDDRTLRGRTVIRRLGGPIVKTVDLIVETDPNAVAEPISVSDLGPGMYVAELDVFSGDAHLRTKRLTFAKLAKRQKPEHVITRSFGIVIHADQRSEPMWELDLLDRQALHSAKLPVWSGLLSESYSDKQRMGTERLTQDLVKRGFALSGVFLAPPASIIRADGAYARPLLEFLSGDTSLWSGHVAVSVAPSATAFRWWEIAVSVGSQRDWINQLTVAVSQLRRVLRPFITFPRLAMPVSTTVDVVTQKLPVEHITLRLSDADRPDSFVGMISDAKGLGYEHVSVLVESSDPKLYRRLPRLADWARRLLVARHAGAGTVYVPQTWHRVETVSGPIIEPAEEFIILRTIADVLGDATPGPELRLGEDVRGLAFFDDRSATVALWDETAPPGGRDHAIQLAQSDRQVDLWGRSTALRRGEDGRQIVRLGPSPVFIPATDRWLVELRASLSITPSSVRSGSELVRHEIALDYKGDRSVSGRIEWGVPEEWSVWPRSMEFGASKGRGVRETLEVVYPHNEPAGNKSIVAKITLYAGGEYLEVPLRVNVGAPDLEVSGMALVENGELVLRQVVRNQSEEVLSFRAAAAVPGRQRQYRPISNLQPGDTQSVQYRFGNGEAFQGRRVRVSLREMNDGPRTHHLELLVP